MLKHFELDEFTKAYIEAALWSTTNDRSFDSNGHLKEGCREYLDADFDETDFTDEAIQRIIADCSKFQAENALPDYIATRGRGYGETSDAEFAGHDFWLTRNGHGAGFWDRGLGKIGERLTTAATAFGEINIFVTDENKLDFG